MFLRPARARGHPHGFGFIPALLLRISIKISIIQKPCYLQDKLIWQLTLSSLTATQDLATFWSCSYVSITHADQKDTAENSKNIPNLFNEAKWGSQIGHPKNTVGIQWTYQDLGIVLFFSYCILGVLYFGVHILIPLYFDTCNSYQRPKIVASPQLPAAPRALR